MLKFERTLPVGLQIYSVRDCAAKDLEGTLRAVKEIGYDYVEPEGMYGRSAEEYKAILDRCGLTAACIHAAYSEMIANPYKVISDCKVFGVRHVAIPYLGEDDRAGGKNFETVLRELGRIGKLFSENGITLLYHNHDFEFIKMPDGSYGFDYMYENVASDCLQSEMDTCWVNVGGVDPVEYLKKYACRCPVVHLKDFSGVKRAGAGNTFEFRPVGYGKQDIPSILTAAIENGAEYLVVEQDDWGELTSLEAVAMSRKYLKSLGF